MVLIEVVLAIAILSAIILGLILAYQARRARLGADRAVLCRQALDGAITILARLEEVRAKARQDPATAREWCALLNNDIATWNRSFTPDCSTRAIPLINCQGI